MKEAVTLALLLGLMSSHLPAFSQEQKPVVEEESAYHLAFDAEIFAADGDGRKYVDSLPSVYAVALTACGSKPGPFFWASRINADGKILLTRMIMSDDRQETKEFSDCFRQKMEKSGLPKPPQPLPEGGFPVMVVWLIGDSKWHPFGVDYPKE